MQRELEIATAAAIEAGEIILRYYGSDYEVRDKGHSPVSFGRNPVTTADSASNNHLREVLVSEFPDYGWFSEETVDTPERLTKERIWVIDPLDGTNEFIEGVPHFVVSIALVEDHMPVLGVLYNPVTEELFTGSGGDGAKLLGESIRCSPEIEPSRMVILTSRSEKRQGLWKRYEGMFSELKAVGSVSYKLGLIAAGKADIFVSFRPKNEWDICAGHCLINEAGGTLLDLKGREVTYNNENTLISPGLVAGKPVAVDNVLKSLAKGESSYA